MHAQLHERHTIGDPEIVFRTLLAYDREKSTLAKRYSHKVLRNQGKANKSLEHFFQREAQCGKQERSIHFLSRIQPMYCHQTKCILSLEMLVLWYWSAPPMVA